MRASFLERREAMHRKDRIFLLALVIPSGATAQYLLETTLHSVHTPLLGLVALTAVLQSLLWQGLRRTLLRWESATRRILVWIWSGYTVLSVIHLLFFEGHALWGAASAETVLSTLASIRMPLASYAPALLVGPLLWAFAHDARTLWARDPRDALVKGYGALVLILVLPLVGYLVGSWWGSQTWLPHVWKWGAFQDAVWATGVAVGIAAAAALIGLVTETWRWRRLEARLVREGWA